MPCHSEIIASYLRGIDFQDGDVTVFADCLPNRHRGSNQPSLSLNGDVSLNKP